MEATEKVHKRLNKFSNAVNFSIAISSDLLFAFQEHYWLNGIFLLRWQGPISQPFFFVGKSVKLVKVSAVASIWNNDQVLEKHESVQSVHYLKIRIWWSWFADTS